MLINSKADGNVPFLPGRARYSIVSDRNPTWVMHKMATGQSLDGAAPAAQSNSSDVATIDPTTVRGGYASWDNLAHGGLFTLLAHYGFPIIVEEVFNPGNATLTTVDSTGSALRTALPAVPFTLSPYECLKAVGGGAGGKVGFLVRMAEQKIL